MNCLKSLWNDNAGFIVSAELVLVATIGVLAMVVGLSEVSGNVNRELEDVGSAFAKLNQSYHVNGQKGHFACKEGSRFNDCPSYCAGEHDIVSTSPRGE